MSTDFTPNDPRDAKPVPESAADEPLLVEAVQEAEPVVTVRRRRPPPPPGPPHPGFWWAVGWCVLLLIVSQVVAVIALVVILVVQAIRLENFTAAMKWLMDHQTDPALLVPVQMAAHITIFGMALLALRFVVGRNWPRQVAIRLPAVHHVLLAVIGAPAFWLISGGLQLIASQVLPSFYDLPSLFVVGLLLMLMVGGCWLLFQAITGKDGPRELARSPLHVQLAVGPFAIVLVLAVGILLYHFISPYIFRIPKLDNGDLLEKSIEGLLEVPWWLAMLVIAVTPAFSEEFWCRAFLGRGSSAGTDTSWASSTRHSSSAPSICFRIRRRWPRFWALSCTPLMSRRARY